MNEPRRRLALSTPDIKPRCLTIDELGQYCNVSIGSLRQWIAEGILPGRIPGTSRWDRKAVDIALDNLSGLEANKAPLIISNIDDLIIDFRKTRPSAEHERYYPLISKKFGKASLSAFENPKMRRDIKKWHRSFQEKARKADYLLTTLVKLLNYALDEALISHHCAHKIKRFYKSNRAKVIWTDQEIELICSKAHTTMQFTILLCRLAGLRRGDLVEIPTSADKGSHLEWKTSKSGRKIEIIVPIVPALRKLLNAIQAYKIEHGITITTIAFNQRGLPWTSHGFSTSFGKERDKHPSLSKHLHDLRGSAATEWKAAGLYNEEIAEILGWNPKSVDSIIRKYVDREAIISATVHRLQKVRNSCFRFETDFVSY